MIADFFKRVPEEYSGVLPIYNQEDRGKTTTTTSAKVQRAFLLAAGAFLTYKLVDAGLSNLFVLETLTHGTGPLGYLGINLFGADPNFGGSAAGSSAGFDCPEYLKASRNYFHVFKDFAQEKMEHTVYTLPLVRLHSMLSGMAHVGCRTDSCSEMLSLPQKVCGAVAGLITPTLKFRFRPEDISECLGSCRFQDDPDYGGFAYRTSLPIESHHLGIVGSLSQGLDAGLFRRIGNHPERALFGLVLLTAAFCAGKLTYRYFSKNQEEAPQNSVEIKSEISRSIIWVKTSLLGVATTLIATI